LVTYEVKAPVPSQCFRTICQQICKVHELLADILTTETLVNLFTKINELFKARLSKRLKELNVINDAGPQHA
jgi:vacuolar protein sorting-associated protein 54